jgi:hypothetical protein
MNIFRMQASNGVLPLFIGEGISFRDLLRDVGVPVSFALGAILLFALSSRKYLRMGRP